MTKLLNRSAAGFAEHLSERLADTLPRMATVVRTDGRFVWLSWDGEPQYVSALRDTPVGSMGYVIFTRGGKGFFVPLDVSLAHNHNSEYAPLAHASATNNPHGVTAAQTGAYTQAQVDALVAPKVVELPITSGLITISAAGTYTISTATITGLVPNTTYRVLTSATMNVQAGAGSFNMRHSIAGVDGGAANGVLVNIPSGISLPAALSRTATATSDASGQIAVSAVAIWASGSFQVFRHVGWAQAIKV